MGNYYVFVDVLSFLLFSWFTPLWYLPCGIFLSTYCQGSDDEVNLWNEPVDIRLDYVWKNQVCKKSPHEVPTLPFLYSDYCQLLSTTLKLQIH